MLSLPALQSLKYFSGQVGYPIRQPADLRMFAPPRRFSQLAAAFLASIRQGIRHKPFSRLTILLFPDIRYYPNIARSPLRETYPA